MSPLPDLAELKTLRVNYTDAQSDTAIVVGINGAIITVTRASALLANSTSVDVAVIVGFGATATPTGAGVFLTHPGLAAGSGVVEGNGSGIIGRGTKGQGIFITSDVPTDGSLSVDLTYYVTANG